jgi:hypothetical protein
MQVLAEIGAAARAALVYNKIDRLDLEPRIGATPQVRCARSDQRGAVAASNCSRRRYRTAGAARAARLAAPAGSAGALRAARLAGGAVRKSVPKGLARCAC